MRSIDTIIIHCTATPRGKAFMLADIDRWHRERGFRSVGYHFVVLLDGTVCPARPLEEVGAHCKGHNAHSIGVCYVGGVEQGGTPADTRTPEQRTALRRLLTNLKQQFPTASIHGHNEFAAKACPCFDVREEYKDLNEPTSQFLSKGGGCSV